MSPPRRPRRPPDDARPAGHRERKQAQLAAQIGRSVEQTLIGECDDEVLQNLSVDSVRPGKGNRLVVTLTVHAPGAALTRDEVLARLEAQRSLIVERAAQDIARRSLPELSFWLVRAPDAGAGEGDAAAGDDGGDWRYDPFADA